MTMMRAAVPDHTPSRRIRAVAASALALAALCAGATPAHAAIAISSLTLTPSNTQAGGNPDITIDAKFTSATGDTPQDATISLGAGILASPSAATVCSATDFAANTCPDSSRVGDGVVTGTVPAFGTTVPIPAHVYLVTPQGSEVARIGVIVDFFDYPVSALTAPVEIRTTPDVGIDIPLTGIPDKVDGTSVQINEISLTLLGTVGGRPFTRLPTSCSTTTTTMTADSYAAPTTQVSATAGLTPTGCGWLAYSPQIAATATPDAGDDGIAFSASITQSTSDSATKSVSMSLPAFLGARLAALSLACPSAGAAGCTPIGAATVTTPLLAAPLQGSIELVSNSGGLPFIDAVFPAPFAFTLQGSPSLSGAGLTASFSGLPDVPISDLEVEFDGGPNSIFLFVPGQCTGTPTLGATLTAQDGAVANLSPSVTVTGGCPAASTGSGSGSGSGTGSGSGSGSATGTGSGSGSGSGSGTGSGSGSGSGALAPTAKASLSPKGPKLTFTVSAGRGGPGLSKVSIKLPSGVSIVSRKWPHGLTAKQDGKALGKRAVSHKGGLQFALSGKSRTLTVSLAGALLKLAKRLTAKPAKGHHPPSITFIVTVKDAHGKTTALRVTVVV